MRTIISALIAASAYAAYDGPYHYADNGESWGGLCANGREQSPINIIPDETDRVRGLTAKVFGYNDYDNEETIFRSAPGSGEHPKSAIQHNIEDQEEAHMILRRNGRESNETLWKPLQFHFHHPSEHAIDGTLFDAEVHFVHTADNGFYMGKEFLTAAELAAQGEELPLAVYGILFYEEPCGFQDEGEKMACLMERKASDDFFDAMRVFNGELADQQFFDVRTQNVPIQAFIDSLNGSQYYSYYGSLTTPPCSENVRWTLLKDPVPISPYHLAAMEDRSFYDCTESVQCTGGNNRVTQPVYDRTIWYNAGSGSIQGATISAIAISAFVTLLY